MSILNNYFRLIRNTKHVDRHEAIRHRIRTKFDEVKKFEIEMLGADYYHLLVQYNAVLNEIITLATEAQRLEVENEFMLKLINEHRIAE